MKIGVTGCTGRMGRLIAQEILSGAWPDVSLAGGTSRTAREAETGFFVTGDADELFSRADAVIDFTTPELTRRHIWLAAKHHKPFVCGTTGLAAQDMDEFRDASKEAPVLHSANTSLGVNLLLALVRQAAAKLDPSWDIEISETHHRHKADAPSGTALALGRAAAEGRKTDLAAQGVYERHGQTGERAEGSIGFSVLRGGDVPGDHTVSFFGAGERLELTHRAGSRALFAKGALRAALWLKGRKNGLYTMQDVLGL